RKREGVHDGIIHRLVRPREVGPLRARREGLAERGHVGLDVGVRDEADGLHRAGRGLLPHLDLIALAHERELALPGHRVRRARGERAERDARGQRPDGTDHGSPLDASFRERLTPLTYTPLAPIARRCVMRDPEIKEALERSVQAVAHRASIGQGTAVTTATLGEGLSARVTDGPHAFTVGMTDKYGGDNAAPNPGVLVRGALAGCLAIGVKMWAVRMAIPITTLEVEVQADYDVRGELGVSADVVPGYSAMRYAIRVTSPAPEAKVRELIDTTVRTSSLIDDLSRAVPLSGDVRITQG